MSELTRAHLPAKEDGTPAQDVDFCPKHLDQVKANLDSLSGGGDLVHYPDTRDETDNTRISESYRAMVKTEEIVKRVAYTPSPEGATCLSCNVAAGRKKEETA